MSQSGEFASPGFDALATGVASLDRHLCFVQANPAFCELVGTGSRRLLGQPLAILHAPAALEQAARRGLENSAVMRLDGIAICAAPGKECVLDVLLGATGQHVLLEARAAATTPAQASRLSESLRGFAHEIRNPLAAISGAAQLLQQGEHDPQRRQLAELIREETARLTTLAERLLGARAHMATRAINVHAMLERVAGLLQAECADVRIVRDYDPSLPALHGDPDRLLQVLLNLARNAVEANAHRIVLRSRAEAGLRGANNGQAVPAIRIEVEDDGEGVPVRIESTLFEPMVSGRANGSGLGLALSREIAREHGGDLVHQRKPGATCFTLVLPRHARAREIAHA
ncbi:MAG TPA: ATP-binding protein [Rhodanobacteraceae bacterium]|jgi:two-component system nitrogen regulation sensor histidine kinase GlnL